MPCPRINYPMCSSESKSNSIVSIPRRDKARLRINFAIKFNRNDSPRETKRCYSRSQNALLDVPKRKVPYVIFPLKVWFDIFIPQRVEAWLCIYITINFNRNESPRETQRCFSRYKNAMHALPKNELPYVFFPTKVMFDNIYSPTC
jgi:hypothetical protein